MTVLSVPDSPKSLREALSAAQGMVVRSLYPKAAKQHCIEVLQRLINECERHRPLGIGGKHSNLHTDTCGCEDKGPRETWATVTPVRGIPGTVDDIIRSYEVGSIKFLVVVKSGVENELKQLRAAQAYLQREIDKLTPPEENDRHGR